MYFAGRIGRSWIEGIYVDIHGHLGAPHAGPHAVKGMNQQPVCGSFRYIFFIKQNDINSNWTMTSVGKHIMFTGEHNMRWFIKTLWF